MAFLQLVGLRSPRAGRGAAPGLDHPRRGWSAGPARSDLVVGSPASCRVSADSCRRAPQPRGPWLPRPALAPGRRHRVRARGPRLRRGAGSGSDAVRARGARRGRGSRPCRSRCVPASVLPPPRQAHQGPGGIPQASQWMNRPLARPIVEDQRERTCPGGWCRPRQRRRAILAVAGVAARDGLFIGNGSAG
jgi:hypothetical protein